MPKKGQVAPGGASLADGLGPAVAIPAGGQQVRYGQIPYSESGGLSADKMNPKTGCGKATGPLDGR